MNLLLQFPSLSLILTIRFWTWIFHYLYGDKNEDNYEKGIPLSCNSR